MNTTLRTEINIYLTSPFLKNISDDDANKTLKEKLIQELSTILQKITAQPVIAVPLNKKGGSKKIIDSLINAHEIAQELTINTKSKDGEPNTPEHNFFNDMDNELLKFTSQEQKNLQLNNNDGADNSSESKSTSAPKSDKEINDFMKVLVESIGKDSPNSLKSQSDLRALLKKYPNKVPEAIVQVIISKIRKNGLGIIFAVQTMSTLLALLIGLIPIPGIAVIADMIIGGTDAFIDGFVALGPESITDFVSNGVDNAMKTIRKDLLPIFKETATIMANTMSGVFCCNKSQQNKANQNMDKYVDVLIQLIKLINEGPSKNEQVESFVRELQNNVIKTKQVNSVDMNALDQLLNKSNESKNTEDSGDPATTTATASATTTTPKAEEKTGGGWSKKYKKSINCKSPHGFSQKQFCKAKNKRKNKTKKKNKNKTKKKNKRKTKRRYK